MLQRTEVLYPDGYISGFIFSSATYQLGSLGQDHCPVNLGLLIGNMAALM